MYSIPILLITFNRAEHTRKVLGAIMEQQPAELFVFQDGCRPGNSEDTEACDEVRRVISELTCDTKTSLHTFYSESNLGCGPGPAKAISWFFSLVRRGIIMEDDCLPDSTMFFFYQYLLDKYDQDDSVTMITATNVFKKWKSYCASYFFATNGASPMGCWAGWAKYWKSFDYSIASWRDDDNKLKLRRFFGRKEYYDYYSDLYDKLSNAPQRHMWDYQWAYSRYLLASKTIVAAKNLVTNIGLTRGATHSSDGSHRFANLPLFSMEKIKDPHRESVDEQFNYLYFFRNNYRLKKSVFIKIRLKILEYLFCR